MGTTYSIKIDCLTHDKIIIKTKIDSLLKNINYHFSTYDIQSEISSINSSYLTQNKISKTFSQLLKRSLFFCNLSNELELIAF